MKKEIRVSSQITTAGILIAMICGCDDGLQVANASPTASGGNGNRGTASFAMAAAQPTALVSASGQNLYFGSGQGQYVMDITGAFHPLAQGFSLGTSAEPWSKIHGQTLYLNPVANSFMPGLVVKQSGPLQGPAQAGDFYFNQINTTFQTAVSGNGAPGLPGGANLAALQVSLGVGGTNFDAKEAFGGAFGVLHSADDTSYSDKVGLASGVFSNHYSRGRIYGGSSGFTLDAGGVSPWVLGYESDSAIGAARDGAQAGFAFYRSGYNAANVGSARAHIVDAAYSVTSGGGQLAGSWQHLFAMITGAGMPAPFNKDASGTPLYNLAQPIATDGDFFYSESPATVQHIFNLGNVTVTGNILKFPNVQLTGDGDLVLTGHGCGNFNGSHIGTCSSDERLKKEIKPFELGLKELARIEPVTFKYNGLGGFPNDGKVQIGVIAQQVEKVAPQLIGVKELKLSPDDKSTTATKTVDYGAFTYMLINSVRELSDRLARVETENAAIKAYLCARDTSAGFCR